MANPINYTYNSGFASVISRGPHLLGKTVFGRFSWFFCGFFRGFLVALSWPSFWSNFTRTRAGKANFTARHCLNLHCVFPVEPQSPNGKNINLHKKWGFRRFHKERREPHFLRKKCAFCTQKVPFPHFLRLFLESAETPLFVQINVFAVWALRLDRKYTSFTHIFRYQASASVSNVLTPKPALY